MLAGAQESGPSRAGSPRRHAGPVRRRSVGVKCVKLASTSIPSAPTMADVPAGENVAAVLYKVEDLRLSTWPHPGAPGPGQVSRYAERRRGTIGEGWWGPVCAGAYMRGRHATPIARLAGAQRMPYFPAPRLFRAASVTTLTSVVPCVNHATTTTTTTRLPLPGRRCCWTSATWASAAATCTTCATAASARLWSRRPWCVRAVCARLEVVEVVAVLCVRGRREGLGGTVEGACRVRAWALSAQPHSIASQHCSRPVPHIPPLLHLFLSLTPPPHHPAYPPCVTGHRPRV